MDLHLLSLLFCSLCAPTGLGLLNFLPDRVSITCSLQPPTLPYRLCINKVHCTTISLPGLSSREDWLTYGGHSYLHIRQYDLIFPHRWLLHCRPWSAASPVVRSLPSPASCSASPELVITTVVRVVYAVVLTKLHNASCAEVKSLFYGATRDSIELSQRC